MRPDAVVATGRSDFPNQVNNVLCFPFIFRGALDVGATTINESMKLAAVRAIADADGDVIGPRTRFRCILQQIDHHLLHLAGVEASLAQGQGPFDVEWHRSLQPGHEL